MVRYQTIPKFSADSGYTVDAVETKIKRGVWLEGAVWIKAPDGRRLIDVEGFYQWAEENYQESHQRVKRPSRSPSPIAANDAGKESGSPPPLRI